MDAMSPLSVFHRTAILSDPRDKDLHEIRARLGEGDDRLGGGSRPWRVSSWPCAALWRRPAPHRAEYLECAIGRARLVLIFIYGNPGSVLGSLHADT